MNNLETLLKEQMGYKKEPDACRNCAYYEETTENFNCHLNKAVILNVMPQGSCNFFQKYIKVSDEKQD